MIVLVTENTETEIGGVGDVDEVVVTKEIIGSDGPVRLGVSRMSSEDGIGREGC